MCCKTPSLRRESAIIESEPVGPGVLLVIVAPLPAFLAVEAGARAILKDQRHRLG
jgi:hypothetical protein